MESKYLKCEFEDGVVFFKINRVKDPEDEYIYEGLELLLEDDVEEDKWEKDFYELTEEDLQEMYVDGFYDISKEEFEQALIVSGLMADNEDE
jgi:hypothetical protein